MAGAGSHETRHGKPDGDATGQKERRVAPGQLSTTLQQAFGTFMAYLLGKLTHALCCLVQVLRQPETVVALQRSSRRTRSFLERIKLIGCVIAVVFELLAAFVPGLAKQRTGVIDQGMFLGAAGWRGRALIGLVHRFALEADSWVDAVFNGAFIRGTQVRRQEFSVCDL